MTSFGYAVISLADGSIDAVPFEWMIGENCYYPPDSGLNHEIRQHKLKASRAIPDENWVPFPISSIVYQAGKTMRLAQWMHQTVLLDGIGIS
jgi:hypothetical protein